MPAMSAWVESDIGLLAILLIVLGAIFAAQQHPRLGRIFTVVPALVFCYFIPTTLSALHVIPPEAALYRWVKEFVLPASLLLLTLALDVRGIIRLGPRAGIMLLAGTVGVILGGPIALFLWQSQVPADGWMPLTYLAGSWIGGAANAVAIQNAFGVSNAAVAPVVVVDVAVANTWLATVLILAVRHARVDAWLGGETAAIEDLERRMERFQARVARSPTIGDLIMILALAFGATWLADLAAAEMVSRSPFVEMKDYVGRFAWKVLLVTAIGVGLSFTKARNLEGAGASKIGGVMIYLLIACIGAGADFHRLGQAQGYLLIGATWMLFAIAFMVSVARLIRAPFFFVAVGSMANIGGAASAPVAASAFNPLLAPVGALLAIAGYVLGTVGGLASVWLCRWVVGAN